jgi:glycosyltransferase involved in cell wall biosynthesis
MGDVKSYNRLTLDDLARQEGLDGYVLLRPRGTRSEALEFLASAAMLVSLPQDSAMAIPSKIFEYMAYDAWLLAMTEEDTATGHLLRGSGADLVAPDDVDAIADVIRQRYREYEREGRPAQPALVAEASREHQSEKLFDALEERLHG